MCISTMISFISCDGGSYYTRLASYPELTNDLLSAEIVTDHNNDGINATVVKVLDIEKVKDNVLSKIAEKELQCNMGPRDATGQKSAVCGIRLKYSNKTIVIDEFEIAYYDEFGKFTGYHSPLGNSSNSHMIDPYSNDDYRNIINSFINEELET